MNSYSIKQTSLTACNVVVYGLLASQGLSHAEASIIPDGKQHSLNPTPYETHASSPSFSQIGNIFSGSLLQVIDQQFVETVSSFYTQLLENQEPLGQDFEQVLHDNLWDLYES